MTARFSVRALFPIKANTPAGTSAGQLHDPLLEASPPSPSRVVDGSLRRTTSAILAAGLLIAGALLRPSDEVLGTVLLWAAALPGLHAVSPWRLR
ncbi:hypothetical protein [Microcella alkalica]|uniref:hypothetical protein n=1 Tax=Microcella alkalica TaxID=355930 RepID=UPI00145F5092|nr:hypothetical protein [Microcella alkalica]